MKKNSLPVLALGGVILLVLLVLGIVFLINRFTPSKERMELTEFYQITDDTQVAIVLNNQVIPAHGTLIDGQVYLDYHFLHDYLNSRFYWDSNENILLYTTASNTISAHAEATNYYIGKSSNDHGRIIVKATADSALVDIDFVASYSHFTYSYYESPSRIIISNEQTEVTSATVKKSTEIRLHGKIKSPILRDIDKKSTVTVLETDKKWSLICTDDGIAGYVRSNCLKDRKTEQFSPNYTKEEFYHIRMEKSVNLLWHQVTSATGNSKIAELITSSKGVNVVSPTWFKVKDNSGNITSLASSDYVSYCHDHNVQVWALVSNFENEDIDTTYLLTHTSSRKNLVNQLVAAALQYNLDGINVDFEAMDGKAVGDGYIQFIRELSIKCENNDIILSVDVPVPASYNEFYQYGEQSNYADYVIVMGYDEHWGQASGEGSVASLNWVNSAVKNALADGVPADQLVLAMPFYTRLWNLTATSNGEDSEYIIGFEHLGMEIAQEWMQSNVGNPVWLEDCGQWYGETIQDEILYKLWLEDTDSLEKRLELVKEYSLAGAAFWKYGFETKEVWDLIIKYIN